MRDELINKEIMKTSTRNTLIALFFIIGLIISVLIGWFVIGGAAIFGIPMLFVMLSLVTVSGLE